MASSKVICLAAVLALMFAGVTHAYEIATHAKITEEAYRKSVLGDTNGNKLRQLGLFDLAHVVGTRFTDFSAVNLGDTVERRQYQFERDVMYNGVFRQQPESETGSKYEHFPYRIVGWMVTGAIREDDGESETFMVKDLYAKGVPDPREITLTEYTSTPKMNRFCNHFHDPRKALYPNGNGRSLADQAFSDWGSSVGCPPQPNQSAAGWALALKPSSSIFYPFAESQDRVNHFTIADAREAMWRAVTGYDGAMANLIAWNGTERMKYWVTTFRALGSVVHLLQDMGNGQHTRDEAHPFTVRHTYEKYVEWKTTMTNNAIVFDAFGAWKNPRQLPKAGWPATMWSGYEHKPTFSKYEHYWQTANGFGLAEYSNRGFLTHGRGIGNTQYPEPPADANSPAYTVSLDTDEINGRTELIRRLYYMVPDVLAGRPDSAPMARRNTVAWTQGRSGIATDAFRNSYSLDATIFDKHAALQLPRAVSYSAGLIDHFFRGQLRIEPPAEGMFAYADASNDDANDVRYSTTNFRRLRFKLTNTTPPIADSSGAGTIMQDITQGRVVAVVKYHKNTCWTPDLSGEWGAPGKSMPQCREGFSNSLDDFMKHQRQAVAKNCVVNGSSENVSLPYNVTLSVECDFRADPMPFAASDIQLVVAIRGKLGVEEDEIVVQTLDISEPSYFVFQNSTDYAPISGTLYKINVFPQNIPQEAFSNVRAECKTQSNGQWYVHNGCGAGGFDVVLNSNAEVPFMKTTLWVGEYFRMFYLLPRGGTHALAPHVFDEDACLGEGATITGYSNQLDFVATDPGSLTTTPSVLPVAAARGLMASTQCVRAVEITDTDWNLNWGASMTPSSATSPKKISFCSGGICP